MGGPVGDVVASHQGHGIGNLGNDNLEGLHALGVAQLVGAVLLEAALGLGGGQAGEGVGVEFGGELLMGQAVGRTGEGLVGLARDVLRAAIGSLVGIAFAHGGGAGGGGDCSRTCLFRETGSNRFNAVVVRFVSGQPKSQCLSKSDEAIC